MPKSIPTATGKRYINGAKAANGVPYGLWRLQCSGIKRDGSGERCKRWAFPGATVCKKHGAALPVVQAAARRRFQTQGVGIALTAIESILKDPLTSDATRIRAVEILFEKCAADLSLAEMCALAPFAEEALNARDRQVLAERASAA